MGDHEFCRWVIGGMAAGYLGLAGVIWKLFSMYRQEMIDRRISIERTIKFLEEAQNAVEKN